MPAVLPRQDDRDDEQRACGDKVRYGGGRAKARLPLVQAKFGPALQAYRCRFCRWWHIGRRPRAGARTEDVS